MDTKTPSKSKRPAVASCVRFADDEYQQIEEDSVITGMSIPALLKERYFSGPRPLPLLSREDLTKVLGELARIGNNLNQIARRVNSGIRAGFVGEFEEVQKSFRELLGFLSSSYCRCVNRART